MKNTAVIEENIKSLFFDFSLAAVLSLLLLINLFIALTQNIFKEPPTPFPYWLMYFFDSLILIVYGGYVGTKLFAREFDKKTITALIVSPLGKKGVYIGKIIAGIIVIIIISASILIQAIAFYMVWGPIPYLFLYWYGYFSAILIFSYLFAFFLSITVGSLIKRTSISLLISSVYSLFSFFILIFMPVEDYVIDQRFFYSVFFPSLVLWYEHLSISGYATLQPGLIGMGALGTVFMCVISYFVFMGVRV